MALPDNLSLVTVTGHYYKPDGSPETGTVTFTPSASTYIQDAEGPAIIVPETTTATLDETGALSVILPATDDTDATPQHFTYDVAESLGAKPFVRNYSISLPLADTPVDLAELSPSSASGGTSVTVPVTVNHQAPDSTGNITITAETLGIDLSAVDARAQLAASTFVAPSGKHTFAGLTVDESTLTLVNPASPPAGVYYTSSTDSYAIGSGQYTGLKFDRRVEIADNNIYMTNCLVDVGTGGDPNLPIVRFDPSSPYVGGGYWMRRRVLEHCEIRGNGASGLGGAGFTARYCYLHDLGSDGAQITRSVEPTVIEFCVFEDFLLGDGAHADGIQLFDAPMGLVRIANNWVAAENKPGRPYPTTNPDTGYTSAMYVEGTNTINRATDLYPDLRGAVEITDNYFSARQSHFTVKLTAQNDVPILFARNRIRRPDDAEQAGGSGEWFTQDTTFDGYGNVDSDTDLPVSSPLMLGATPARRPRLRERPPAEWLYGDKAQPRDLADCGDTLTLTTGTAYATVVTAREALRGHTVRVCVGSAGTVTACDIAVYRGTLPSTLQLVGYVDTPVLTAGGVNEFSLTVSDPEIKFPFYGIPDGTADFVADEADLIAYVITTTSSAAATLAAHTAPAGALNRNGRWDSATTAIAPGSLPTSINLDDGTWTAASTVPWFALGKGYPET